MLSSVMNHLRGSLRRALRTAMLSAGAALFLLIGLLFLTLAAWLYLITVTTALTAALILGAVYFGVGFLLLAMAGSDRAPAAQAPRADQCPTFFETAYHSINSSNRTSSVRATARRTVL